MRSLVGESEILEDVDSLLGKVLPLGIVTFVMITSAVILLAWGSFLGQFLFQIPAKDSLSVYSGPTVLLAVGLTLTGAFLNHKLTRPKASQSETNSAKAASKPSAPKPFNHVLVPGGKDEEPLVNVPTQTRKIDSTPSPLPSSDVWTFKDAAKLYEAQELKERDSPRLEEKWSSFVVPDRLEARIDAFTFNCQECKGVVSLPWAKIRESFGGHELPVDCPNCHRQYPFDYEKAKRKTLNITFYGSASQSKTPEASKDVEVSKNVQASNDVPQPVPVENGRTFGGKAKTLFGPFPNRRVIHPIPPPIKPSSPKEFTEAPETERLSPVIDPDTVSPETVSVNTPLKTTIIAPNKETNEAAPQWKFKDTKRPTEPSTQEIQQPPPVPQKENAVKALPDQLKARIDGFSFTCQECSGVVDLPWAKIRDGLGKDHLSIDCPNCHKQFPFDYEKAKRKTLSITFFGVIDRKPIDNPPEEAISPKPESPKDPESAPQVIVSAPTTPPASSTPEAIANPVIPSQTSPTPVDAASAELTPPTSSTPEPRVNPEITPSA